MNYIQYNETQIPVTCNYRVIKVMKSKFGVDISAANIRDWYDNFENIEKLYFEMVQEGYRQEKKECPFTLEDVEDILCTPGINADFLEFFLKDVYEFVTPTSKKKLTEVLTTVQ